MSKSPEETEEMFRSFEDNDDTMLLWGTQPFGQHSKKKRCCCGSHSIGDWKKRNKLRRILWENSEWFNSWHYAMNKGVPHQGEMRFLKMIIKYQGRNKWNLKHDVR